MTLSAACCHLDVGAPAVAGTVVAETLGGGVAHDGEGVQAFSPPGSTFGTQGLAAALPTAGQGQPLSSGQLAPLAIWLAPTNKASLSMPQAVLFLATIESIDSLTDQ